MKILNEGGPYLMWFNIGERLDLEKHVPDQGEDHCPECAAKILNKIHRAHNITDKDVRIEGDSCLTMSNESCVENVCVECGIGLYTELID